MYVHTQHAFAWQSRKPHDNENEGFILISVFVAGRTMVDAAMWRTTMRRMMMKMIGVGGVSTAVENVEIDAVVVEVAAAAAAAAKAVDTMS